MRKFTLFIALVFVVAFTQAQIERSISVQKAPPELNSSEAVKAQTAEQSNRGVFWSEYFTDGVLPAGWQNVDNSGNNFVWICTNQPPGGTYSANIPVISSTSGGHFMQLRGDYYNTPMPTPTNKMDAYFQTPPIDCSERNGVVVAFNQYFRYYSTVTWVLQVSNDNVNWVSYDLKEGLAGNASSANPVKMEFNISSVAANQPTVYLRWYVAGTSHYFWMVDDIELTEPTVNDIQLAKIYPEFYGIGFYSKIPTTQVQDFYFSATVSNFGIAAQHNVRLNGVASDFLSNVYFDNSSVATDIIESEAVDTFGIETAFALPAEVRSYEATFSILQDEVDDVPGNNVDKVWFDVTDSIYARDITITTRTGPSNYTDGVDGDKVGVVYYFPNDEEINSITVFISSYSTEGTSFIGKLLVDDGVGNLIEKATTDIYTLSASDIGQWITVPIIKDGASEFIEAGSDGILAYAMIECYFEGIGDFYVGADQSIHHIFEDESLLMLGSSNYWISMVPAVRINVNVQGAELSSSIITRVNTSCNGVADGEAVVYATGGTLPYTYLWSNGATNDTNTGLVAGTYYVTVSDNVGATTLDTVIIEQPEVLAITAVIIDEGGYQASDGEINITTNGGTYPYSYVWNTGSYSDDIENLAGGTYTITVTDANDCVAIESYEVAGSACGMTSEISGTNVSCFAGNDGTVNFTVANGTAPYTFEWLSGQTTEDLIGLEAGYYSVTGTDAEGCISYANITLEQPTAISSSSVAANALCNEGSDGSIDLSVSGGTAPYTYEWNNGALAQDVPSLSAGDYVVTITDAKGCELLDTITISAPNALVTTLNNIVTLSYCNGGKAIADMSYTGGTIPYTYLWSTGSTAADLAIMTAPAEGTYIVTVTDSHGCIALDTIVIDMPDIISVTGVVTPTIGTDGAIDITAVGGTTPFTYTWSNAATTEDLTGLSEGIYTVTVKDSHNCTSNYVGAVNDASCDLTVSLNPTSLLCNGDADGSIALDTTGSSVSIASYAWSNGATTQNLSSLVANIYTVTVTDDSSCVVIASAVITEPEELSLDMIGTDISCNGLTDGAIETTVSGGTTAHTYLWDNGETTTDITGLSADTYSVIVTDANNCTVEDSVTIIEPSAILASIVGIDITCNGNFDGSADLSVSGGTAPYTYDWSNNAMTQDLADLLVGTYAVTVIDANACEVATTVDIAEPSSIEISIVGTDVLCYGNFTGVADLSVSGGITPYTITWSNSEATEDVSDLAAGTYTVVVLDSNSCSANASVVIAESAEIVASIVGSDITCNGLTDGEANLTVTGGVSPYAFAWDNAASTEDLTGLSAGTYNVVVTDSNACTATASVIILEPTALSASATGTNVLCNGAATGDADLTVTGGTAPFTYAWNNSATTQDLTNVVAGTYNVIVSDVNVCTATASVSITEPTELIASTVVADSSTSNDVTIDLTVTGGVSPYTFAWSNDSTTEDITIDVAATYSVTITDANGCSVNTSEIVIITAINDAVTNTINIYPNPSKGLLNVSNVKGAEVSIYNIIGETIIKVTSTTNNVSLDMSELSNGTYIVRIVKDSNVITKKVMLKK